VQSWNRVYRFDAITFSYSLLARLSERRSQLQFLSQKMLNNDRSSSPCRNLDRICLNLETLNAQIQVRDGAIFRFPSLLLGENSSSQSVQMVLFMQADTQRVEGITVTTPIARPVASVNQRRSQRILLAIPLLVKGTRSNGAPFSERTKTLVVNAHGGLLMLHEAVLAGQLLTLTNVATSEEIICKVIDINAGSNGTPEIGVEFAESCPRFWRVSFPPADWSPRSLEARRLPHRKPQSAATSEHELVPPPAKK
jgi:hypothetical protein